MSDSSKEVSVKTSGNWSILKQSDSTIVPNAYEVEDEFGSLYDTTNKRGVQIIEPPYNLTLLDSIAKQSSMLAPCIDAMVGNIDGTGYTFEAIDGKSDSKEDPAIIQLEEVFSSIGINGSFVTIRKEKRRSEETIGVAYLEVLRNLKGDVVFLRNVDGKTVRLIRLDEPVQVQKTIVRNGVGLTVSVEVRERRFAQISGGHKLKYFKEFGASRNLNKYTGDWEKPGKLIPVEARASEFLYFTAMPDAHTPYGIPRWLSQLPSVLGAREAEEFNLEFFKAGGVPPAIIFLQGGQATAETKKALESMSMSAAIKKQRIMIMELEPSGGSLDKADSVKTTMETFGAGRQSDSMFEKYDDKCAARIRRAFRLPPLFLGESKDYNFATSWTAYMVAEQQIFKPERMEFDEIISKKLLPAMGAAGYKLVSKPMMLKNADTMMLGVDKALSIGGVNQKQLLDTVNDAVGTDFVVTTDQPLQPTPKVTAVGQNAAGMTQQGATTATVKKSQDGLLYLAMDLRDAIMARDKGNVQKNLAIVSELSEPDRDTIRTVLSKMVYISDAEEDLGLAELAGCGATVLARDVVSSYDTE